jgi:benzoyl-CoA reductase/2-hydroxyglutaryl-CoA dehydratase subunit BcrC/BadD/HgdB
MNRLTSQEMQEIVEQYGEVKFTRKQLKVIRALMNATTKKLVNEYSNKNSKSFQVALSSLSKLNFDFADYCQEVNDNFKREVWFDANNLTRNARRIW